MINRKILTASLVLILLLGVFLAIMNNTGNNGIVGVVDAAPFIIDRSGNNYRAWYCPNSTLISEGTNVSDVYNSLAWSLSSRGGGTIGFAAGTFVFDSLAGLYPRVSIKGQGASATVFVPSVGSSFQYLLGTLPGWNNVTMISVSDIGFNGSGASVPDGLNAVVGMCEFTDLFAFNFRDTGLCVSTIPSAYVSIGKMTEPETHIVNCEAYFNGKTGISLSGSDSYVDSCLTGYNGRGFLIQGFNHRVINCHSYSESPLNGVGYQISGNFHTFIADEAESGAIPTQENTGFYFASTSTNDFNVLQDCYVHNVGRGIDFTNSGAALNSLQILGFRANLTASYPIVIENRANIKTLEISDYRAANIKSTYDIRNYGTITQVVFGTCTFNGATPIYNTGTITSTYFPFNTTSLTNP